VPPPVSLVIIDLPTLLQAWLACSITISLTCHTSGASLEMHETHDAQLAPPTNDVGDEGARVWSEQVEGFVAHTEQIHLA